MKEKQAFNLKVISYGKFERYKVYKEPFVINDNKGNRGKRGEAKDRDNSVKVAMFRAKEKIRGYVLANDWEYWATQTFSPEALDRFDLDEVIKKYNRRLWNLKQNKYSKLKWLIVPETHKNGAWHLHMLMSGIPSNKIAYSGYDYFNKEKQFSRPVFNWLDTIDYGFNDYIFIGGCDDLERFKIASYITKYITKDLAARRFNKKLYWCSRDLKLPDTTRSFITKKEKEALYNRATIVSERSYYVKDNITGEVFNEVTDLIILNV